MFIYVYIIESTKYDKIYIGYTTDLNKRLREHNRKMVFSTKPHIPWKIIHFEAYRNKQDAERREKYLKSSQGMRLLGRMLKEYFYSKRSSKT